MVYGRLVEPMQFPAPESTNCSDIQEDCRSAPTNLLIHYEPDYALKIPGEMPGRYCLAV
jgi:hypothetical protein